MSNVTFIKVCAEQIKLYGRTQKAIIEAIKICRDKDVLKAYLANKAKEVENIMPALFDKDLMVDLYEEE